MVRNSHKQSVLLESVNSYFSKNGIAYSLDRDSGDHLFIIKAQNNSTFTLELCSGYVEFYDDKSHDLINYDDSQYIDKTIDLIELNVG